MQTAAAASLATARKKPLRYLEMAKTLVDRLLLLPERLVGVREGCAGGGLGSAI